MFLLLCLRYSRGDYPRYFPVSEDEICLTIIIFAENLLLIYPSTDLHQFLQLRNLALQHQEQ